MFASNEDSDEAPPVFHPRESESDEEAHKIPIHRVDEDDSSAYSELGFHGKFPAQQNAELRRESKKIFVKKQTKQ